MTRQGSAETTEVLTIEMKSLADHWLFTDRDKNYSGSYGVRNKLVKSLGMADKSAVLAQLPQSREQNSVTLHRLKTKKGTTISQHRSPLP